MKTQQHSKDSMTYKAHCSLLSFRSVALEAFKSCGAFQIQYLTYNSLSSNATARY